MTNERQLEVTTRGEREIVMTRRFDAPRHLVYAAYTKCELLRRWLLGPPGWRMEVCEVDLTVGGGYRYVWRREEGDDELELRGSFREVVADERLVSTEVFNDDWTQGEAVSTLVFEAVDGGTRIVNTIEYSSSEVRDGVLQSGMDQGVAVSYNRLDGVLEEQMAAA